MKKHPLLLNVLVGLLLFSCSQEEEDQLPLFNNDEHIVLNTSTDLNSRVKKDGIGVVGIISKNNPTGKYMKSGDSKIPGSWPIEMIGQINLPKFEGNTLHLTGIDIFDNHAFITYKGDDNLYLGAIEILDLSSQSQPKIMSQAIFTNASLNDVKYSQGKLYIPATFNMDSDPKLKSRANIITVSTSNGVFSGDFRIDPLKGEHATGVSVSDNHIITSSSNKGIISLLNKSNSAIVKEMDFPDLKQVVYASNRIVALNEKGEISLLDPNSLNIIKTIKMGGHLPLSIEAHNGLLYVSEGSLGSTVYDLSSANQMTKLNIPQKDPNNKAHSTQHISSNDKLLLMANGAAGMSIFELKHNHVIEELGNLELKATPDMVKTSNQYIIASSKKSGTHILRINTTHQINDNGCAGLKAYDDCSWIIVKANRPQAYSGITAADGLEVSDQLTYCGSLSIKNFISVHPKGSFNMRGNLTVGSFGRNTGMIINERFTVEGNVVIYGNLFINKNAKIEFLGDDSKITVHGKVTKQDGHSIKGKFNDTEGKF
ncbi:LVIVD repeat-containing protein [Anditalea andensis]|uniref:Lipoprotein n=1 Tax=Anditalea andensis TaxID=1048983 RepID=A0A074LGV1_9BACT|nr:hypothetical protein [Anditalea andensis]KEO73012.1 hypothetical protein EL17_15485 [Anditalea andensis]